MNSTQLLTIKEYQRDFEEKYNIKLHIDWIAMKGMPSSYNRFYNCRNSYRNYYLDPQVILEECVKEFGANLGRIKDRKVRLHNKGNIKERMAVEAYSRKVIDGKVNLKTAAKLINRDRTMLYHYAMRYDQNMQSLWQEERKRIMFSSQV